MDDRKVPAWLDRAAALSWRYVFVLGAVYVTFLAITRVTVVVLPVVVGLFITSVLSPIVQWLKRRGLRPILATWLTLLVLLPVVVGIFVLLVSSLADGLQPIGDAISEAVDSLIEWLRTGPLGLSDVELDQYVNDIISQIQENAGAITSGVLGGATAAVELFAGLFLTFVVTFFYLKDGDRAAELLLERVEDPERIRRGFEAAWGTISGYMRGLAIVGLVDAVFIGVGLAIVGTPLIVPIMVLVFVGGFFPFVGALISGSVAVAVTFVNGGLTDALIVALIVIAVQQIEGDVMYPIVFKQAVQLHPLVVLLAVGAGAAAFGLIGAFLAVPLTAMVVATYMAVANEPERAFLMLLRAAPYERSSSE